MRAAARIAGGDRERAPDQPGLGVRHAGSGGSPRLAGAVRITLVLDNLNTHTLAALYETFAPAEALRIAEKLELVDTLKHGSWLTVAEIELSVLGRPCLARRIADPATLIREVAAWAAGRNADAEAVDWQFTTQEARIKLKQLYPVILNNRTNAVA